MSNGSEVDEGFELWLHEQLLSAPAPPVPMALTTSAVVAAGRRRLAGAGATVVAVAAVVGVPVLLTRGSDASPASQSIGSSSAGASETSVAAPSSTAKTREAASTPAPESTAAPTNSVQDVRVGDALDLPSGKRLVIRSTSVCLLDAGEAVNDAYANCGVIRNGNTPDGGFTLESYGDRHRTIYYGIGDAEATRVTMQLANGEYLPVTILRPSGASWTGYYAIGPADLRVPHGPGRVDLRAYNSQGHEISP